MVQHEVQAIQRLVGYYARCLASHREHSQEDQDFAYSDYHHDFGLASQKVVAEVGAAPADRCDEEWEEAGPHLVVVEGRWAEAGSLVEVQGL